MNLTTQDEQVECFRTVAAHLEVGGRFVIEVGVPALQRLPPGETVPPPPIAVTLGFEIVEAAEGRAVFAVRPDEYHYNPIGAVHGVNCVAP